MGAPRKRHDSAVAPVLILLDGRPVEQVEIVVASLAIHVETGGSWIDLYGIERIAVLGASLLSPNMIQLLLADKFQQDLKIYYERQENAFHNFTDEDLERMEIEQQKAIELRRLASTFLIADGEVDKASRLPEVFDDEKSYAAVFGKFRLTADSRKILLCYKVQFRLRKLTVEIESKGYQKYWFARRARNLTWALVCQGMLNDTDLEEFAEKYGTNMSVEAGFMEWMRAIAVNKVRLLLSDLVSADPYRQRMEEERYDFLRTRAAYDFCMERAYKKWKWVGEKLR